MACPVGSLHTRKQVSAHYLWASGSKRGIQETAGLGSPRDSPLKLTDQGRRGREGGD